MNRRIFIIAGEASGDVYGSYLIRLLQKHDPDISIQAIGGSQMESAGAELITHIRDLSVMGFVEVISQLGKIRKLFKHCRSAILTFQPDTVICIDYPGFNLRMAPWIKSQGIRTIQYISPKVWAWKETRIKTIRQHIDELICIFPFEIDYYAKHGISAHYFGNPLHHSIKEYEPSPILCDSTKPVVALLPGSRKQEVERILPVMLEFASTHPEYQYVVGAMSLIGQAFYENISKPFNLEKGIHFVIDRTYDLLSSADFVINTSGTITLESFLFGKPQIVVYKTHPLSYHIIKRLIKIKYISLPNILSNKQVVPELIQHELTVQNLGSQLLLIQQNLQDPEGLIAELKPRNEDLLVKLIFS